MHVYIHDSIHMQYPVVTKLNYCENSTFTMYKCTCMCVHVHVCIYTLWWYPSQRYMYMHILCDCLSWQMRFGTEITVQGSFFTFLCATKINNRGVSFSFEKQSNCFVVYECDLSIGFVNTDLPKDTPHRFFFKDPWTVWQIHVYTCICRE